MPPRNQQHHPSIHSSGSSSAQGARTPEEHPHAPAFHGYRPDSRPIERRKERLKGFTMRLRERRRSHRLRNEIAPDALLRAAGKGRRRRRKAALALSAAAIGVGSGSYATTISPGDPSAPVTAEKVLPEAGLMRLDASQFKSSDRLKEAIAQEEGVRLTVYRDVGGHLTVGVGHRVTAADGLSLGDTVSYDHAIDLLERDLALAEGIVRGIVGDLPLFQNEFDALVDLVYNVGEGTVSAARSPSLNAAIAQSDYDGIGRQLVYKQSNGRFAPGLAYRSERRTAIFRRARYEDPRPAQVALAKGADVTAELS